MKAWCVRVTESPAFNRFIIAVIVLAGILIGIETSEELASQYHGLLAVLDKVIITIFIAEIAMKMIALAPRPQDFFKDPWNCFDFVIVAVCLLPAGGAFGPVLRLFRLLRVLKLLTAVPKLQLLVGALLKSLPSMGYVTILLFLLFYIYGVIGVIMFGKNDPVHFGTLAISVLSLFRVVTLEDWTDVMYLQIYGSDGYSGYNFSPEDLAKYEFIPQAMPIAGTVFFVSFVLIGTMIMLNLVIGVIINGMDDAKLEAEIERIRVQKLKEGRSESELIQDQLTSLNKQISDIGSAVAQLAKSIEKSP